MTDRRTYSEMYPPPSLYPPLEETRWARMLGILLVLGMVAVALAITGGAIWFWTR